jgi:hypothetical protein
MFFIGGGGGLRVERVDEPVKEQAEYRRYDREYQYPFPFRSEESGYFLKDHGGFCCVFSNITK